jgi:hypothetical protein
MGVPAELLGKQVRCPHCKQVLLAPVTAGSVSAQTPASPPGAPDSDRPAFTPPPRKEGADSILGEPDESEDEVFGGSSSAKPRLDLTDLNALPPTDTLPNPLRATEVESASIPSTAELSNLFAAIDPSAMPTPPAQPKPPTLTPTAAPPRVRQPLPIPVPAPVALPVPVPPTPVAAPPSANPFANLDASDTTPALPPTGSRGGKDKGVEEVSPERDRPRKPGDDRDDQPPRGRRKPATNGSNTALKIALALVAAYALIMTVVAVYGLFFKTNDKPEPTNRKKASSITLPVDDPTTAGPPRRSFQSRDASVSR